MNNSMKIESNEDMNQNSDDKNDVQMNSIAEDEEGIQKQQQNETQEKEELDSNSNGIEDKTESDNSIDENYMKREAEFFKFHPFSFIDDVHESAHDYCADSADFIESCLLGHPLFNNKQEYKDAIQEGTDKVWSLLEEIFTDNLNKYEEYLLSNIFNIPDDLVLPHKTISTNALDSTTTTATATATATATSSSSTSSTSTSHTGYLYNKSINILDKELEDLRANIQKLTNDNNNNKIKIQNLENDISLLKSIDSNLSTDFNNIENINMINQQRKILDYNYQVLKSNNNNSHINNNNNPKSISIQKSILDKMNSLNLDESDQSNIQKEIKSIESSNQLFERFQKSL